MLLAGITIRRSQRGSLIGLVFAAGALAGTTISGGFADNHRPAAVTLASPEPVSARPGPLLRTYAAEVIRVVDGDTFEARVQVWPGLDVTTKVRLRGIDAPEMSARCAEEQSKADAARNALAAMLAEGDVGVSAVSLDKYGGRVLASASSRKTPDISAALLAAGVARVYSGGRRDGWCGSARG